MVAIVKAFRDVVQDLGAAPEMSIGAQVQQILEYVDLRRVHTAMDLVPKAHVHYPEGWTDRDEQIWIEWLNDRFSVDVWQKNVIYRALGSHMPFWDDWISDELHGFLPWWIQRSTAIVDDYDMTPLEEESSGSTYSKVDPYIAEHGSAKQRRDAMAGRH